ncbi:hypothetical protein, partial [Pseudomonas viridiflava]|uniref:hypothetical protein n=1 Tax=Pseudomonas viridiflava TaxID=33069 RepID=UPI00197E4555
ICRSAFFVVHKAAWTLIVLMLGAHRDKQVRKTRKTGAKTKVTDGMHTPWEAARLGYNAEHKHEHDWRA